VSITIREATAADWPEIFPFWTEIVADGETYAYPDGLSEDEARELWLSDEHAVVATDADGTVLGTAKMGPNRPGRGRHVGTASFMVAPAARGRGVARQLAAYMIDWHRRQGFRAIQFNAVVETNLAAVHLWQDLGFRIVGTVPEAFA